MVTFDRAMRDQVRIGLRLGNELNRIRSALKTRCGRDGNVAATVDRYRPTLGGVGGVMLYVSPRLVLTPVWNVTAVF